MSPQKQSCQPSENMSMTWTPCKWSRACVRSLMRTLPIGLLTMPYVNYTLPDTLKHYGSHAWESLQMLIHC